VTRHYDSTSSHTVSRDLPPKDRAFEVMVAQSGKPILDADINLSQDLRSELQRLLHNEVLPSGFLDIQRRADRRDDFGYISVVDSFLMSKRVAWVRGVPVVVEYTNSSTDGVNLITLAEAPLPTTPASIKRTDFVFLEVWKAQVAPSPKASGTFQLSSVIATNTVTIDCTSVGGPSVTFTAVAGAPAAFQFQVGGSDILTANNLVAAINTEATLQPYVSANNYGSDTVTIFALTGGTSGNTITLASSGATIVVNGAGSGPSVLSGGANRPNKPSQTQIYRHGNVDSDSSTWLDDDLEDPVVNTETSQRIQIQYRIRVYPDTAGSLVGINPKAHPDGFSQDDGLGNLVILASGGVGSPVTGYPFVPADGATVDSNSDASTLEVDPGLWIAGDGSETAASDLGSVDGYVYALPIAFVYRRNNAVATGGFDPENNANGALPMTHGVFSNLHVIPGGTLSVGANMSDRPDGFFYDKIEDNDVHDLRKHVYPTGLDFASELKYQYQSLLDGTNRTWAIDGSDKQEVGSGSGDISTRYLSCDEIGRTLAMGGNPAVGSGNTGRGENPRNFDHIARRFGSQPVREKFTLRVPVVGPYPAGITLTRSAGTTWHQGDVLEVDFSALLVDSLGDWSSPGAYTGTVSNLWPTVNGIGTQVVDVRAVHDDGHSTTPISTQEVQFSSVVGLGTTTVELTLDANAVSVNGGGTVAVHPLIATTLDDGSARDIILEFDVVYPPGAGLTSNVDFELTPDALVYPQGPLVENNGLTSRPLDMEATWIPKPLFRQGFREVVLEQVSAPSGNAVTETVISSSTTTLNVSRRIHEIVSVTELSGPTTMTVDTLLTVLGSSSREITLSTPLAGDQVEVEVEYYPRDAIANAGADGYQVAVYYRALAPMTAGVKAGAFDTNSGGGALPTEIALEVLEVGDRVLTGTVGPGSNSVPYPYLNPLAQIPCANNRRDGSPITFVGDWWFASTPTTAVADFSAETGLLNLFPFVMADQTTTVTFGHTTSAPTKDAEFRGYYDYVHTGRYRPTVASQSFVGPCRHKSFTPVLARATSDSLLYRKGELLLVVLSRFAEVDEKNQVVFANTGNTTSASVYRCKNNILTRNNA
jgi:hypothetical protein